MMTAVRQRVTVQPGGRVEVQSPDLPAGSEAEVIVLVDAPSTDTSAAQLAALKQLQESLQLSPEAARQWIEDAAAASRNA